MEGAYKTGYDIAEELAGNENWELTFETKNFVKFRVKTTPGKIFIDDLPEFESWDIEQWQESATKMAVAYSMSEYDRR